MHVNWAAVPFHIRAILVTALMLTIAIALGAFRLSFEAQRDWAESTGLFMDDTAWIFPLLNDCFLLVGELSLVAAVLLRLGRTLPMLFIVMFGGLSVWFNLAHSSADWGIRLTAMVPPVASICATILIAYLAKALADVRGTPFAPPPTAPGWTDRNYGQMPPRARPSARPSDRLNDANQTRPNRPSRPADFGPAPAPSDRPVDRLQRPPQIRGMTSTNEPTLPASSARPSDRPSARPSDRPSARPSARRSTAPTKRRATRGQALAQRRAKAEAFVLDHIREHGDLPGGGEVAKAVGAPDASWGRRFLRTHGDRLLHQAGSTIAPVVPLRANGSGTPA